MSSVNKVILIGRLGADPEIRNTDGGQSVCNLRVATDEKWKDRAGAPQERTEWHNIVVWGKQAEICGQYLAKGRQVYIEGRLQSREYEKDGQTRKVWDIVANVVQFLGSRDDSAAAPAGGGQPKQSWGQGNQGGGNQGGGNQGQGGNQAGGGGRGWGSQGGGNQGGGNQGGNQGGGWGNQGGNQGGGSEGTPF